MDDVRLCEQCGELFKGSRSLCYNCKREEDNLVRNVMKFIKREQGLTAEEIAEELEIEIDLLFRLIEDGRIVMDKGNEVISCQICEQKITRGKICSDCATRLSNGLSKPEGEKKKPAPKKHDFNTKFYDIT